jgi:hypothetical protein
MIQMKNERLKDPIVVSRKIAVLGFRGALSISCDVPLVCILIKVMMLLSSVGRREKDTSHRCIFSIINRSIY